MEEATEALTAGDPPRNKIYNLSGNFFEVSRSEYPLPFTPPKQMIFEIYFFRQLYDHLAAKTLRKDLPLLALRNMSLKLMQAFGMPGALEVNFFGNLQKPFCTWSDIQDALINSGHPTIRLSPAERLYRTLSNEESSRLARGWFNFVMIVTVLNLTKIMWPPLAERMCDVVGLSHVDDHCSNVFNTFCIIVFSVDYFTKLCCTPFVRMELVEVHKNFFCTEDLVLKPMPPAARVWHFVTQGDAMVDLVAILPWWMDVLVGNFLPGASFLRVIRLARLMRIFKSAKYLDMVQVLGLTLWKSIIMVAYLFILIMVIALIAGCLLQQFEQDMQEEAFQSVPGAGYWIFSRLISMKDTPYVSGKVQTQSGIVVLAATLTLKGVMWIVPIAHIKQIFSKEYSYVTHERELRMQVREQVLDAMDGGDHKLLSSPNGTTCAVLSVSSSSGFAKARVPLPIQRKEPVQRSPLVVTVSLDCHGSKVGETTICMLWMPGAEMQEPDALPCGILTLTILEVKGLQGPLTATWEVPNKLFGCITSVVNLENSETRFPIRPLVQTCNYSVNLSHVTVLFRAKDFTLEGTALFLTNILFSSVPTVTETFTTAVSS
ncbi:unnamed protein product [Cladocopium goreaui]|uniref:Potassium voltage-gated channel subfamily D member 2 n=1 Tax=Cladocopium goreaui TaxID=2562237 RepID=A0A9P1CA18_9DINO|nr:unnamed protein product [Cladocopium goreaui]